MDDAAADGAAGSVAAEHAPAPSSPAPSSPPFSFPRSRIDRAAEAEVLALVQRGQEDDAVTILMNVYGEILWSYIFRLVRNRAAADDLRQVVFLEAFQGLSDFQGRSSCYTWLTKIALHRCLDYLKRERKNAPTDSFDVLNALAWQPDPGMDAGAVAVRQALDQCLGKIPEPARNEVLLKFHFGLSYVEIEELTGVAAGTIQVRVSRILPRLRRCLRGQGFSR